MLHLWDVRGFYRPANPLGDGGQGASGSVASMTLAPSLVAIGGAPLFFNAVFAATAPGSRVQRHPDSE